MHYVVRNKLTATGIPGNDVSLSHQHPNATYVLVPVANKEVIFIESTNF